jgi:hypothetical protein
MHELINKNQVSRSLRDNINIQKSPLRHEDNHKETRLGNFLRVAEEAFQNLKIVKDPVQFSAAVIQNLQIHGIRTSIALFSIGGTARA